MLRGWKRRAENNAGLEAACYIAASKALRLMNRHSGEYVIAKVLANSTARSQSSAGEQSPVECICSGTVNLTYIEA